MASHTKEMQECKMPLCHMNGSLSKIYQMMDFDDFVSPRVFLTDLKTNCFPNNMFLHPNVFLHPSLPIALILQGSFDEE